MDADASSDGTEFVSIPIRRVVLERRTERNMFGGCGGTEGNVWVGAGHRCGTCHSILQGRRVPSELYREDDVGAWGKIRK